MGRDTSGIAELRGSKRGKEVNQHRQWYSWDKGGQTAVMLFIFGTTMQLPSHEQICHGTFIEQKKNIPLAVLVLIGAVALGQKTLTLISNSVSNACANEFVYMLMR